MEYKRNKNQNGKEERWEKRGWKTEGRGRQRERESLQELARF